MQFNIPVQVTLHHSQPLALGLRASFIIHSDTREMALWDECMCSFYPRLSCKETPMLEISLVWSE